MMATSAEPRRKRAYSADIRWRVVYQRIALDLPFYKIAENLNIASSTAHRTYQLFLQTGQVETMQVHQQSDLRRLSEPTELHVVGLELESPATYLSEVCQSVKELWGIEVSPPTVCRTLKRYGITRKKIRQVALQRCNSLRGAFMAQICLFRRDMFVWLDETGSDARDHVRKFGYAIRGMRAEYHRLLSRGRRVNAIGAISCTGLEALELTNATVNLENFFDFLRGSLIPKMMPFNGNNPKSILIMDNLSVHHTCEVKDILQQAGILVLYLPPYSPDLNPIEEAFGYVKSYLKKHDELLQIIDNPTDVIKAAFESITTAHCNSWITNDGYPN